MSPTTPADDAPPTMLNVRAAVRAANAHRTEYEIRADFARYREELTDDDLDDRDSYHEAIAEGWGREHPRDVDHPRNRKLLDAKAAAERAAAERPPAERQAAAS